MTRRIGIIGYDGITALDLTGPAEVFGTANAQVPGAYEIAILAASAKPIVSEAGLRVIPDLTLANAPRLDTILVPGGSGLRDPAIVAPIAAWLKARRRTRRKHHRRG